jgi:hypothetical protein
MSITSGIVLTMQKRDGSLLDLTSATAYCCGDACGGLPCHAGAVAFALARAAHRATIAWSKPSARSPAK